MCENVCVIDHISRLCFASLLSCVGVLARTRQLLGVLAVSTFRVSVSVYMCVLVYVCQFCCLFFIAGIVVRTCMLSYFGVGHRML